MPRSRKKSIEYRNKLKRLRRRRNQDSPTQSTIYSSEDHFTADQYEQNRADGWKKLKPNAVLTIFNNRPPNKTRRMRKESSLFRQLRKYATNNEAEVTPDYILWSVSSEDNETRNGKHFIFKQALY